MTLWINEFHYDNPVNGDPGEFIEVAGTAGTALTGWSLVLYNGGTDGKAATSYLTVGLTGTVPNLSNGFGAVRFEMSALNSIQNGSFDGMALVDAAGTVVQFLSYEGVITAANGPAAGMTSLDVGVSETNATAQGTSLQLTGIGNQYGDFTWAASATSTPNAANLNQAFTAPGPDTTPPQFTTASVTNLNKAADIVLRVNETVTLVDAAKVRLQDSEGIAVQATVTLDGRDLRIDPGTDLGESKTYEVVVDAGALTDAADNPIAATKVQIATAAPPTVTRIHDVQGAGATNAMNGQIVTVEAIVFGDFQNGDADTKRDGSAI